MAICANQKLERDRAFFFHATRSAGIVRLGAVRTWLNRCARTNSGSRRCGCCSRRRTGLRDRRCCACRRWCWCCWRRCFWRWCFGGRCRSRRRSFRHQHRFNGVVCHAHHFLCQTRGDGPQQQQVQHHNQCDPREVFAWGALACGVRRNNSRVRRCVRQTKEALEIFLILEVLRPSEGLNERWQWQLLRSVHI